MHFIFLVSSLEASKKKNFSRSIHTTYGARASKIEENLPPCVVKYGVIIIIIGKQKGISDQRSRHAYSAMDDELTMGGRKQRPCSGHKIFGSLELPKSDNNNIILFIFPLQ